MTQPFSIQCATCQSRLTVRDPALIGQILACPKCQSMVLVEAPDGAAPPEDSSDESERAHSTDVEQPQTTIKPRDADHQQFDSRADTKPMAVPSPEELAGPEQEPILPSGVWSSRESRQLRRILSLSGIGVAAVVIAVALCGFWISRSRNTAGADPAIPPEAPVAKPLDESERPTESTGPQKENSEDPLTNPPQDDPKGENNTNPDSPTDKPNVNEVDPGTAGAGAPEQATDSDGDPPSDDPGSNGKEEKPAEAEPPGFTNTEQPRDTPPTTSEDVAASLRHIESLLSPGDDEPEPDRVSPIDLIKPRVELAEKPGVRKIDLEVQLQRRVENIEIVDAPLIEWLRLLSQWSTIPITLDPAALRGASATPQTTVTVRSDGGNIGEVLNHSLAPLGLHYQTLENGIRIMPIPDSAETVTMDISDLSDGSPRDVEQLAAWITKLVAPETWNVQGGDGRLTVRGQSLIVATDAKTELMVKRFLDRVRVARSLETKYGLPARAVALDPPACEKLQQPVATSYRVTTPIHDVLRDLSEQADLSILVDWDAVQAAGWNHEGRVRLRTDDQPLGEALSKLLATMELAYRVIDDETIQVTTPQVVANEPELVFHDLTAVMEGLGEDPQVLTTVLRSTIGDKLLKPRGPVSFVIDTVSRRLIASAPAAEQEGIAELLKRLEK